MDPHHQWTACVIDNEAGILELLFGFFSRAMCGDHDFLGFDLIYVLDPRYERDSILL